MSWDKEVISAASLAIPRGQSNPFLVALFGGPVVTFSATTGLLVAAIAQLDGKTADTRIICGKADVDQSVPLKDKWAWGRVLSTYASRWMPQEVNDARDRLLE